MCRFTEDTSDPVSYTHLDVYKRQIHALLDTGNSLCDPVTGKPVCILGKRQAGEILKEKELQTLRYIPYCSVGTEKGVLPVIRAEKMCIHTGQECWVEKPLIGICEEDSFTTVSYTHLRNGGDP